MLFGLRFFGEFVLTSWLPLAVVGTLWRRLVTQLRGSPGLMASKAGPGLFRRSFWEVRSRGSCGGVFWRRRGVEPEPPKRVEDGVAGVGGRRG